MEKVLYLPNAQGSAECLFGGRFLSQSTEQAAFLCVCRLRDPKDSFKAAAGTTSPFLLWCAGVSALDRMCVGSAEAAQIGDFRALGFLEAAADLSRKATCSVWLCFFIEHYGCVVNTI